MEDIRGKLLLNTETRIPSRIIWDHAKDSGGIGAALAKTEERHTRLQGQNWVIGRLEPSYKRGNTPQDTTNQRINIFK